jgi:photosystem II stability/assembly factor-like uncharacterized protein
MGGSSLGSGLWTSDDTGKSWKHIGWKHGKTNGVDILKSSNGKHIYLARGDGLLTSSDEGTTWKMLTDWRQTEVMDVAVDQTNPSLLFIATAFGMWRSKDSGSTWSRIVKGLTPTYISRIVINPIYPNRMAAATDKGVFISNDRGESWRRTVFDSSSVGDVFYLPDGRLVSADNGGSVRCERMGLIQNGDLYDNIWTASISGEVTYIGSNKGIFIVDPQKDVISVKIEHMPRSMFVIGTNMFIGTLGGGLYVMDTSKSTEHPRQIAFQNAEVVLIRAFEIQ